MNILKSMMMAGVVLVAGAIFAADGDQPKAERPEGARRGPAMEGFRAGGPGGMMGGAMNNANWLGRFLEKEENLDKLGIKGEARAKLVKELGDVSAKTKDLQDKIREASMAQGKLAREVMEKPGADIQPVLDQVKKIGDYRTEQSILSTKVLAILRDNLSKEQRDQVRDLMMQEGRSRMEARREFNGNMERRRPQFGERRRNRGGAEGAKPAAEGDAK